MTLITCYIRLYSLCDFTCRIYGCLSAVDGQSLFLLRFSWWSCRINCFSLHLLRISVRLHPLNLTQRAAGFPKEFLVWDKKSGHWKQIYHHLSSSCHLYYVHQIWIQQLPTAFRHSHPQFTLTSPIYPKLLFALAAYYHRIRVRLLKNRLNRLT